jgi:hypothetical protein
MKEKAHKKKGISKQVCLKKDVISHFCHLKL